MLVILRNVNLFVIFVYFISEQNIMKISLSPLPQEVTLSEVLQVRGPAQLSVPSLPGNSAHSFEVVTASLVYCVVAGESGPAWESAIRQALMPVQSSGGHGEENQGEPRTTPLDIHF